MLKYRFHTVVCTLGMWLVVACAPEIDSNVEPVAQFYFERIVDSLPLDTSFEFRESVAYDSTGLDSLTRDWTQHEWLVFWRLVAKKQANHKSSAVNAAGK
jgi:hypothetical protein